ncbi:hypothetical protein [Brevibacillus sp. SYSU BS000544]|uniref:hypothetical protein n=1 Tax=Brevibacillus sp. SYSU BS000544 TaxID=3416443 RepID=UPI003CE4B835
MTEKQGSLPGKSRTFEIQVTRDQDSDTEQDVMIQKYYRVVKLVSEKELLLCYEQVEALFTQSDENGGKELVTRNLPKNL